MWTIGMVLITQLSDSQSVSVTQPLIYLSSVVRRLQATPGCSETCGVSGNGLCEDGGPDSIYEDCGLGTDCIDCGTRDLASPGTHEDVSPPAAPQALSPPLAPPLIAGCTETCGHTNNGLCEDGGPDSLYEDCALGTDCQDCGPRGEAAQFLHGGSSEGTRCSDSCEHGAGNGLCEDGGPGTVQHETDYFNCEWGTDCTDCGTREGVPRPPALPPTTGRSAVSTVVLLAILIMLAL